MTAAGRVLGWRCAVCTTSVDVAEAHPFTCPRATTDDRHHVLHPVIERVEPTDAAAEDAAANDADGEDPNPFVAYRRRMAWWAFGAANGMSDVALVDLARGVADGFTVTPFGGHTLELGGDSRRHVWIKDETVNVAGSHKARHLVGILLHLLAAERDGRARIRPPLAIASCGNAAIAAATLAGRVDWPLRVFVPDWADDDILDTIATLGADVVVCPRRGDDPPGDPALLRCRQAVATGALPFTVQGPENALCLDGGRTIGWEVADAFGTDDGPARLDRVVVQVGGGALAACVGWGLGPAVRLDTVQAQGCAPLARAWWRASDLDLAHGQLAHRWGELMTPWERPRSRADGILDDETYDWLADVAVMTASGGRPIVVPEEAIVTAHRLATSTGIAVSATGTAGLAGLLVGDGRPAPDELVAVIFSGVQRSPTRPGT